MGHRRSGIARAATIRPRTLLLACSALLLTAFAGCGSGDPELTAEEFVADMNAHGAALALGDVIATNPDGVEVHAVRLTRLAPSATGEGSTPEAAPAGATLVVFGDSGAARDEFDRCEVAPALTCFRAANAVLRVEDLEASDQARLTTALEAIAGAD